MLTFQPGDVVATSADTLIGLLIRKFSRSRGEAYTAINHVGVIVKGGALEEAEIVEALHRVRRHKLTDAYGGNSSRVRIWRHVGLTHEQRAGITEVALKYVGFRYGYLKIIAHAIDRVLFGGAFVVRRLFGLDRFPICSYVVARAFRDGADYEFGADVRQAQPDDIDDHCRERPGDWKELTPLVPLDEWAQWREVVTTTKILPGPGPADMEDGD